MRRNQQVNLSDVIGTITLRLLKFLNQICFISVMVHELKISFSKNTPTIMINILNKHDSEIPSGNASQMEELYIANEDLDQLRLRRYYLSQCFNETFVLNFSSNFG